MEWILVLKLSYMYVNDDADDNQISKNNWRLMSDSDIVE